MFPTIFVLQKALFTDKHFDDSYNFSLMEEDPVSKTMIRRIISNPKPGKDLDLLASHGKGLDDHERMKVAQLADLLNKMFDLDPEKRIKVSEVGA
jgi:serine/threonine-protein kinase PRP4